MLGEREGVAVGDIHQRTATVEWKEFKQLYDSLRDEFKPRSVLERHYVADIAEG